MVGTTPASILGQVCRSLLFASVACLADTARQTNDSVLIMMPASAQARVVDIVTLSATRGYIAFVRSYTYNPGTYRFRLSRVREEV
jgi:hypothetical protein